MYAVTCYVQQSANTTIKVTRNLDGLGSAPTLVECLPIVPKALNSAHGVPLACGQYTPVIPAPGRWAQEGLKVEDNFAA